MDTDSWAVHKLSEFLGFDDETLKTQVLPYLKTLKTADEFSNHLMEMLGSDQDRIAFIQEYTSRQFAGPKKQALSQASSSPQQRQRSTPTPTPPPQPQPQTPQQKPPSTGVQHFPSLPATERQETEWPSNINVYMKKENEGDYFRSSRKAQAKQKTSSQSQSSSTEPTNTTTEKKKKKKNEMTLEAALKELHIKASTTEKNGKRRVCHCQATKHPLLTVAPNCLNCGKIICTAEGPGPCTFCGTPVLSKEQQVALIAEAKRKRAEQKQRMNATQQPRKAPSAATPSVGYASKVSGDIVPKNAYQEPVWDEKVEDERRRRAEAHKEKLLEFQRTSAKRTTVIDQATDFTLPSDQLNPWLSPQERALLLKKQQANLKKLQNTDSRRRVMTIDVQSRQVVVNEESASSDEDSEPEEPPQPSKVEHPKQDDGSAGTFAHNPLLKGVHAPKFIGKQSTIKGGKARRRKERVQFDDMLDDYEYATSVADDRDIPVEPNSCINNY